MKIPQTLAEFKKLPSGTKLVLIQNAVNTGLGPRTILGLVDRGETMTVRTHNNFTAFLPLSGRYFYTENTFGFLADGGIAAEYKFAED